MADPTIPAELIPSLKAKHEAEARKFDAEALAATALARFNHSEAAGSEIEVQVGEIVLAREKYKREVELVSSEFSHSYYFGHEVGASSVSACMSTLDRWRRLDKARNDMPSPIEITFFSPGGSVVDGLALMDFIGDVRADGHFVTTYTHGMAASMAGILLQAGDLRVMGRESSLLIHQVQFSTGGSFGAVEDRVGWIKGLQERVLEIFEQRARPINNKTTKAFLRKNWERKDWWLSAPEAVKLGLVDKLREAPAIQSAA